MPFQLFENTLECFVLLGSWKSENMESHFQIKNMHDHQKLQKAFDGHADKPDSDSKHYFCKRKCGFYASVCGK